MTRPHHGYSDAGMMQHQIKELEKELDKAERECEQLRTKVNAVEKILGTSVPKKRGEWTLEKVTNDKAALHYSIGFSDACEALWKMIREALKTEPNTK